MKLTRRSFAAGAAGAVATFGILRQARGAVSYKMASNLPAGHPMLVRIQAAIDMIKADTNGELEIKIFPNSQLGGDLEVLTQLRSGAVQFYPLAGAKLEIKIFPNSQLGGDLEVLTQLRSGAVQFYPLAGAKLEIKIFPNSQLGGDLEVLTQLRSGAVQFYPLAGAQLSTLVPIASRRQAD